MTCPRCRSENAPDQRFCGECGVPLAIACAVCNEPISPGQKFCGQCGAPLGQAVGAAFASPEAYTPKHLAEKILLSKGGLEGERKQVTVLFADLKSSMELLADRDPEEARKILDPVLEGLMEAVHRYEGTVNQVMGDGIMALFGAPLAHEDHAVRACYAALRMQESVTKYARETQGSHSAVVKIRVGLNSGEVVVRAIGSDLRMDYTAVGQTTHLAGRMEQLADPGAIVITAATRALVEGYVEVKSLGLVPVKGLAEPVEIYEVTGAGVARTRLQAGAQRGLTRFVGRDAELVQLRRLGDQASARHGQVVAIVGDPGVGKSRLVWEFAHSLVSKEWGMMASSAVSHGKATPYLPIVEFLRTYFRVEDGEGARTVRERIAGQLEILDPTLLPTLPALLTLLDTAVPDEAWQALDPQERRQRVLDSVKRLVLRESAARPLLLVFEDLQWIDSETQTFLDGLVVSLPTARLLLLVTYRPEYEHGWGGKGHYTQLRIHPLFPESAEKLLHELLGDDETLTPLKRVLTERAQGNPFFLEESVWALAEASALAGERGRYHLTRRLDALDVPATIQAVLAARIDRLSPSAKGLLQAASVIGTDIPLPILQATSELSDAELPVALASLQAAEFLYEAKFVPDREYRFNHALTQDVAYQTLLHERRRVLHGRVVEAIERLYDERLPEWVDRLAHHAVGSAVWEKAFGYLQQAGAKAKARSAYQEAASYFEQALDAGRHLPPDRAHLERMIDLRFDLRGVLIPLGRFERAVERLAEAEVVAEALGDQRRLGRISAYLSASFRLLGEHARSIACGLRALGIAATLEDFALQVAANCYLGETYAVVADYPHAMQHLAWNSEHVAGDQRYESFGASALPAVLSHAFLAQVLADQGAFPEGRLQGSAGLTLAEAARQPFSQVIARWGLGYLYVEQGETETAIPLLEQGVEMAERLSIAGWGGTLMPTLGYAYAVAGRLGEAIPLLEESLKRLVATRRGHALFTTQLAHAYLGARRGNEASQLAADALSTARRRGERGYEARALHILAEIVAHAAVPNFDIAIRHEQEALALAQDLGMQPLAAHCHVSLGNLYRRTTQREQAHNHFTTGMTMYREMDMPFWLKKAERETGELS